MESKTPRTDEKTCAADAGSFAFVDASFARRLEAELAKANELLLKTNQTHIENQQLRKDLDGERETNQRLTDELTGARAEIERLKEYTTCTLVSVDNDMDDKDLVIIKKDELIEQMREIMEAVAGIPGKDWLWGKLALGEILDGKPGPHCEWALKSKADYEAALSAAERGENGN